MSNLLKLPPKDRSGHLNVVVESPRGSSVKLKYEPELKAFTLSRPLINGLTYPYDWGFVPGTMAEDGDPIDAMVMSDFGTFPGVVLACRPVGVVCATQKSEDGKGRERNDRLMVIPCDAPRFDGFEDPRELPERTRQELETFFLCAVIMEEEKKQVKIEGWKGPKEAERLLEEAIARAAERKKAA